MEKIGQRKGKVWKSQLCEVAVTTFLNGALDLMSESAICLPVTKTWGDQQAEGRFIRAYGCSIWSFVGVAVGLSRGTHHSGSV